jgi:hypothetical protein
MQAILPEFPIIPSISMLSRITWRLASDMRGLPRFTPRSSLAALHAVSLSALLEYRRGRSPSGSAGCAPARASPGCRYSRGGRRGAGVLPAFGLIFAWNSFLPW